jgi:hypothetical protein
MRRLAASEEKPLAFSGADAAATYERLERLRKELRPRLAFVDGPPSAPVIHNLVGSVQISAHLVVDIAPKVEVDEDWQTAVIDLLAENRIHGGGQTKTASLARRPLADAFAYLYADQLERAVRTAGPLHVMRHVSQNKAALTGRLDVTQWTRARVLTPHLFPQDATVLTAENEFTRALAWVAVALAVRVTDSATRFRLLRLSRDLRPGLPERPVLDPDAAHKPLPPQWREYAAAWATACAVLLRISPLHREGTQEGLNLAVEPWPLLERLLSRSLRVVAQNGLSEGHQMSVGLKSTHPMLKSVVGSHKHGVEPDGLLLVDEKPVASFEVKYSTMRSFRDHTFQALTTAAAVGAPLAVLIYPQAFEPQAWTVVGATTPPTTLAAIGVDMYRYRFNAGEQLQGGRLWDLVSKHSGLTADTEGPLATLAPPMPAI